MLTIIAHFTHLTSSSFALIFQTESGGNSTPIWTIIFILLLLVLLFWWGMTRNKIPNEEAVEALEDHGQADAESTVISEVDTSVALDADTTVVSDAETTLSSDVMHEPHETAVAIPPLETPVEPDYLKRIEGIGPKISSILVAAGITTFSQLANTDVAQLNKIVREDAGIRISNPTSWPQQAQLAAAGDWDGLQALQDTLTAGRH